MSSCMTPYTGIRDKLTGVIIPVPCGKCPSCRSRKVSEWSFRLMQQDKVSYSAHFVTLTYAPDSCPVTSNNMMTLCKSDVQKWFKRLRKLHRNSMYSDRTIKYMIVGEYGGRTFRPHYHAIIFDCPDVDLYSRAWSIGGVPLGHVHVGSVTGASVGYTLKYISKVSQVPKFDGDLRLPEFRLMSKGLGKSYLTDAVIAYHNADLGGRLHVVADGKKVTMCRYYKDRIYDDASRDIAGFMSRKAMLERTYYGDPVDHVSADLKAFEDLRSGYSKKL